MIFIFNFTTIYILYFNGTFVKIILILKEILNKTLIILLIFNIQKKIIDYSISYKIHYIYNIKQSYLTFSFMVKN
jgi:hypothetical protein